jgi:MFS family permease
VIHEASTANRGLPVIGSMAPSYQGRASNGASAEPLRVLARCPTVEHVEGIRPRSERDWQEIFGRVGLVAKGVSYALVGALAIGVALGIGGDATSRDGALHALAGNTFGEIVLALLSVGFAAYALWRVLQALFGDKWTKRIGYLGRAAIYFALAYSAARILFGDGSGDSQNEKAHKTTGMVLSWPAGRWLVVVGAIVVIGVGVWNLYRGISKKFEDKWVERSDAACTWGGRAGVVGHVARFVVFTLIGVFAIKAAIDYNPRAAVGLDGALQKLAHQSYGSVLLGLTAAGLVAYGIFCFVDARYRDVSR